MQWNAYHVEELVRIDTLFSLFITHYQSGFHFPGETHDFWECLYVLKGSACVSGDDRVYNLSAGDMIFHKPMELHKFYIDHEKGATLLIFSFTLSGSLTHFFKDKIFRLTNEQKQILASMQRHISTQIKNYETPYDMPRREQYLLTAKESPLYLQWIVTYLHQLLLSLSDTGSITAAASTSPDAMTFQKAVHYMTDHIGGQPTVLEIARHCNLSESGIKRIFAKYAGLSVHKYFLKLKFKEAAELLRAGMNVNQVTERLNFSSQSYFSVSFKRETGKNPSQFLSTKNPQDL